MKQAFWESTQFLGLKKWAMKNSEANCGLRSNRCERLHLLLDLIDDMRLGNGEWFREQNAQGQNQSE
jgi:hypothetical protein